ncbi:MAG: nucleoside-diphosphate sugar epimerase/dehydratase [Pseudomonadota bacterium]|nr:nucleoside-diphosphate sugar epimerase/dehydratase [Pseudomonadota bacterium]
MTINRSTFAFIHDVIMAAGGFVLSLFLRLGDNVIFYPKEELLLATVVFTIVAAAVFRLMRLYNGVWRYASINDLFNITKAVSLTILIFLVLLFTLTRLEDLPRSLPIISWFVLIALLGGPRFLYRLLKDRRLDFYLEKDSHLRIPVLLFGAGDGAELFIRDVNRTDSNYRPVGIISSDSSRVGRNIHGVEIMGTAADMETVFEELSKRKIKPQRLIITSERFRNTKLAELFDVADGLGMTVAMLPSLSDFSSNKTPDNTLKPIEVEDLLGRPQTSLDKGRVKKLLNGKRVLVTGAGGTIGSELVRQVSEFNPAHISLLDSSEYNLFTIDLEMRNKASQLSICTILADVRDRQRVEEILGQEKPDIVFHAAALKHVPMVEANVFEGICTNIIGTKNVADASIQSNVSAFVQISTDKAVNPTSVMGVSKRISEQYCQALDFERAEIVPTSFVTVRFGNVLGSTGSVVEIFRKQLVKGGPLTVTHPDMTRYFMTISESVSLVLQAAAMGSSDEKQDGRIFVLDMGDPVRIMDLARQMIRLSGLVPNEDIDIEITGIRPGEKLFEEILHGGETTLPSDTEGVHIAFPRAARPDEIMSGIKALEETTRTRDIHELRTLLKKLVPEYQSDISES